VLGITARTNKFTTAIQKFNFLKTFQANLIVFTAITSELLVSFITAAANAITSFLQIKIQFSFGIIPTGIGMLFEACIYTYIIRVPSNTKINQVTTRELGADTQS
jgi:hypothetical protein